MLYTEIAINAIYSKYIWMLSTEKTICYLQKKVINGTRYLSEDSYECYLQKINMNVIDRRLLWMLSAEGSYTNLATEDSFKCYLLKKKLWLLSTKYSYKCYLLKIVMNFIYWR